MRKISDVWKAVKDERPANISDTCWKRSYEGVKAALKHVGYELVIDRDSFDAITIPLKNDKGKDYSARKIIVTRAGCTSEPTRIDSLLTGNSGVLTVDERLAIYQKVGVAKSAQQPKGIASSNNAESCAVDELDALLGTADVLQRQHLYEFRLADIAYSLKGPCDYATDLAQAIWHAEQIKHAIADKQGRCMFHMTVAGMMSYLNAGLSLTCIGKSADDKIDVVWFFHGAEDIELLRHFDDAQLFQPQLHLAREPYNKFTMEYNAQKYRYDVGRSADECKRLLERKVSAVRGGVKHTLEYLNEDDSQIPSPSHRIEQKAFALTRAACRRVTVDAQRYFQDAYGPVDFRVDNDARIQDKVFNNKNGQVPMRKSGHYPYNPDGIDVFQLTDIDTHKIYALPMRQMVQDGQVESSFSETALMRGQLCCSAAWKEANKQHLYDLKDEAGIRAYANVCTAASQIPQLTDREWYSNMLTAHADKFGSKKQLKQRKAAAEAAEAEDTAESSS